MPLDKFNSMSIKNPAPYRGTNSSEDYNDTLDGVISDIQSLQDLWNNYLQPLLDTLPGGDTFRTSDEQVDYPDAFTNGLDGDSILIDNLQEAIGPEGTLFYNKTSARPKTIKEVLSYFFSTMNEKIESLNRELEKVTYDSSISALNSTVTDLQAQIDAIDTTVADSEFRTGRATISTGNSFVDISSLGFSDTDYSISLSPNLSANADTVVKGYSSKTADGFRIELTVVVADTDAEVSWTAIHDLVV
jgi:hypothetical protein